MMLEASEDSLKKLELKLKDYRQGRIDPVTRIYWDLHYKINLKMAMENTKEGDAILDVGCGAGKMLIDLAKAGRKCYGIDPLQEISLKSAQKNAGEQEVDVSLAISVGEKLPLKDGLFDMVLLMSTLQHVADQEHTMMEVKRVLKKNGMLLISVPTRRNIYTFFLQSKKPNHFNRDFEIMEMRTLLRGAGFEIQKLQGCGFFPPLSYKILTVVHSLFGKKTTDSLISFLDVFARQFPSAASSIVVLCGARNDDGQEHDIGSSTRSPVSNLGGPSKMIGLLVCMMNGK